MRRLSALLLCFFSVSCGGTSKGGLSSAPDGGAVPGDDAEPGSRANVEASAVGPDDDAAPPVGSGASGGSGGSEVGGGQSGGGGGAGGSQGGGGALLEISGPSLPAMFPNTEIGRESSLFTFAITNKGEVASGPLTVAIVGDTTDAAVANTCQAHALEPSTACMISVRLKPLTVGLKAIVLTISGNPGGTLRVSLSGMAVPSTGKPILRVTSNMLMNGIVNFGSVGTAPGNPPSVVNFQVVNAGSADAISITVSVFLIAGQPGHKMDFLVANSLCGDGALMPGQMCPFQISFKPTAGGQQTFMLYVQAVGLQPEMVKLVGTGTP